MNSLDGYLLVASPQLAESTFAQTVVLMIRHSAEGALGVVLNRPTTQTVQGLWKHISSEPCPSTSAVSVGGPVSGPLMALHRHELLSDLEVPSGLYVAATKEHLEQLVRQTQHPFRVFVGQAVWVAGQLERELAAGVWMTTPSSPEFIFAEHEDLWKLALRQVGQLFYRDVLGIDRQPVDATVN